MWGDAMTRKLKTFCDNWGGYSCVCVCVCVSPKHLHTKVFVVGDVSLCGLFFPKLLIKRVLY